MAKYHLAPALVGLRNEINVAHPERDKSSDGWIGDASHQASKSDHNPDYDSGGVVRAIDIDKDGIDADALVAKLIKDPRVNYVIWNGYIWSRKYNFQKRKYNGSNPHKSHVHTSLRHGSSFEKDTKSWGVSGGSDNGGYTPKYVKDRQALLVKVGYKIAVDGVYGKNTVAAVKDFQAKNKLAVDGRPGPKTTELLDAAAKRVSPPKPSPRPPQIPQTPAKNIGPNGPGGRPNCEWIQRHLNCPRVDNRWGPDTDKRFLAVRDATAYHGRGFPFGVKYAQDAVGTKADGDWGPKSEAALKQTIKDLQITLNNMNIGVGVPTGTWGAAMEAGFKTARRRCKL